MRSVLKSMMRFVEISRESAPGVEDETKLPTRIKNHLDEHGLSKEQIAVVTQCLSRYLVLGKNTSAKYLNTDMVELRFGDGHGGLSALAVVEYFHLRCGENVLFAEKEPPKRWMSLILRE